MNNREKYLADSFIIDVETTDIDLAVAEVVQLGYATYNLDMSIDVSSKLYRPFDGHISPEVSAVNNITSEMVADSKTFSECIQTDLNDVILGKCINGSIIAHNSFYDRSVLDRYNFAKKDTKWLCTLRMAKKLYMGDTSVTKYNLPYLRYRFNLQIPTKYSMAHDAGCDCYMTAKLLEFFITEMEDRGIIDKAKPYREQIESWVDEPIISEVMQFGKHKGTPMVDIPLSYWRWAITTLDSLNSDSPLYDKDFAASIEYAVTQQLTD